ncbi:carboxypeptidase regulatory-like domain-containing protein [Tunturiibacter gelidiferens]|uniref:carboxypeptidase regulatory-like domain-containing protein n=1 Tax=Tunturiibacter gelidiferens TaxID=3069689 RepID=UPI003D9B19C3
MRTREFSKSHSSAKWIGILAVALFALFLAVPTAIAQSSGEVSGTISDSTGAIIAGATVTLKNLGTNAERVVKTDSAGIYAFTNVQPAQYTVTASSSGFGTTKTDIVVAIGGHVSADEKLQVSNSSVTVEVSASQGAQVNTQTPEVSQVIDQQQISQLPSLTRNPYDFVALSGNISSGDNTAAGGVQNGANRGVNYSLNGQRNSGTEILLDGVENITVFGDSVGIIVPIDSVQEYRVITNNFGAEYGRASGGVVAVATKSGTNSFHGSAWEFNRLGATTANTVANAQAGLAKGNYTRNQFGGAVGGPILKDKLFFFASTELTRVRSSANQIAVVPSAQLLAAAPANVQSFFSTYGGNQKFNVLSTTTNLQAGGGTTPLYSTLDPSLPIFNNIGYATPNDAGGGVPQNTYNVTGRLDYNLGEKTQAFFRYANYHEVDAPGSAVGSSTPYAAYNVGQSNIGQAYLLSVAHEFNPSLSSITKASFARLNVSNAYDTSLQQTPTLIVAPNAQDPFTGKPFQFPGFYDTNPANGGLPFGGPQNTVQINQDMNLTKGRHQIQGGAQILYIQENSAYGAYAQASEQLGKNTTVGLANFLTGDLFQFQAAVNPQGATPCARNAYTGQLSQNPSCTINLPTTQPQFARSDRFHDWAAYVQDQWKVTPKFTFNYGLRYEYYGVQHNNNRNLDANFYYGAGSSIPEQVRNGSVLTTPNSPIGGLWNPQYGTASPRIGFAYDVFGDGKTSVRGGYGISYERNFGNVTFNVIQNPPNYAVVVIKQGNGLNPVVTNSNAGPLAGSGASVPLPPTSLRHVDQNIRTAQTQFYSLSVDQQVGHGSVVELTYNGARGLHLYDIKNYNIQGSGNFYLGDPIVDPVSGNSSLTYANPHFTNDNNRGSNGDSYYQAVNLQFSTQNIHRTGLSLIANYTIAHATDDLSTTFSETSAGNFSLGYTNPYNPALDHGNSDFDIRHRLVIAPIWRTPYFAKKTTLLGELLGGYELTGIYTVRTGTPFTLYDSTNDASGYSIPRYVPSTPLTQHTFKSIPNGVTGGGADNYVIGALPTAVPISNAALTGISDFGPYPAEMTARNAFRGPGAYNVNVSISKQFPIREGINFELRAEGYDVTNHHNLYIQGATLDVAQSGTDGDPYAAGTTYPIKASKGGVTGGANDERRFLQFAGKINF